MAKDDLLTRFDKEVVSRARNNYLHEKYEGETAYILTCGPSIDEVWNEELREFLKDKLVLAVKQTHDLAPEIVDFHLYNEVRHRAYDYPSETIRVSVSEFMPEFPSHIHYPIQTYEWDETVFVTDEYEPWRLDNSYERPWGIGIMFEIGLFLPVHFGCDKILIMGFDMNKEGKYHFYDESKDEDSDSYGVDEEEFYYAQRTIPALMEWINKNEVTVRNYSPKTALDIPQVDRLSEWKDI
ncbi:hypothetical protein EXE53_16020 [Halorubrum sp. SD626R]|uniref:hypothetical protein n=1 Tax=Halorubrum sp. SD626R TaxID=1419722 RepID=UPI0010F8C6D1|nr:hypothetical protein [Halorubrum sp. SD626R]TKX79401.1 hypothetical protein EXE53_16020 [Halorubrum sp. SD626R]